MLRQNDTLYTLSFLVLCSSYALFGASFNMLIPELPSFLTSLGGENYKGFIISLFTLTAGLSRPISGKLSDTIGRVPVMIIGAVVCIVCSLMYPLISGIAGFLFLRLIHGFSTGFTPTAITAYVADIVPDDRRGEAMGILGVSINLGASASPPIGSYLTIVYSLNTMFFVSSGIALLSVLLLVRMKETLSTKEKFRFDMLKLTWHDLIDRNSLIPAAICGLSYFGFGVVLTIVPDQCEYLGMSNKGMFFTSITVFSILSRLVAGKLSDKYGRIVIMTFSAFCLAFSYLLMAFVSSPVELLVASGAIGFSIGLMSPALFAWTIDRSSADNRGKAMGTMYIGLELAIGVGALMSAAIYQNDGARFGSVFFVTTVVTSMAILFLLKQRNKSELIS